MKKKTSRFLMLPIVCSALSSCVYYTPTVPDMPYQGSAGRTTYPDTWVTTQPAGIQQAPIPDPVASQPISQPANAPLDLTRPIVPGTQSMAPIPAPRPAAAPAQPKAAAPALTPIVTKPAPAAKPAAAAQPAAAASAATDMSKCNLILGFLPLTAVAIFASTPAMKLLQEKYTEKPAVRYGCIAAAAVAMVLCVAALASQSYNPFIYFRF